MLQTYILQTRCLWQGLSSLTEDSEHWLREN
jgi:hypothetical protein